MRSATIQLGEPARAQTGFFEFLFSFHGRFSRLQFWHSRLLQLVYAVLVVGASHVGARIWEASDIVAFALPAALTVPLVIAYLTSCVKRWHDLGRSGWWQLVELIPFGVIYTWVMCGFVRGNTDANAHGPAPTTTPAAEREVLAGGLMILLGLFIALWGYAHYRPGTLMHMGPGYMPTALGIILTLLGAIITAPALSSSAASGDEHEQHNVLPDNPQWWGWFCILVSPCLFIIFGYWFGMAPGTFACVFIAALGDEEVTFRSSSTLALIVTGFGVALFSHFLQVPLPVFSSFVVELVATFCAVALLGYFAFKGLLGPDLVLASFPRVPIVSRPLTIRFQPQALIIALVLAAVYEAALFFVPLTATFLLAALLAYFWVQQMPRHVLMSFLIEVIPPVFAVGLVFYKILSKIFDMDGHPNPVASFFLAVLVAAVSGLGLYIGPYVHKRLTGRGDTGDIRLFRRAEPALPFALALVVAISAVLLSIYLELFSSFMQRGLL